MESLKSKLSILLDSWINLKELRAGTSHLLERAAADCKEAALCRIQAQRVLDEAREERQRRIGELEAEAAMLKTALIRMRAERQFEDRQRNTENRYNFNELELWEADLNERENKLREVTAKVNSKVAEMYALRKEREAQSTLANVPR